jgi:hypothetical protein
MILSSDPTNPRRTEMTNEKATAAEMEAFYRSIREMDDEEADHLLGDAPGFQDFNPNIIV